jgi:hypothetical protein
VKGCISMFVGITLLAFSGCSGSSTGMSSQQGSGPTTQNEWTWSAGSNLVNQSGVTGRRGRLQPSTPLEGETAELVGPIILEISGCLVG